LCNADYNIFKKQEANKECKMDAKEKKGGWGWLSFTLLQKVDTHAMTIKLHAFTREKRKGCVIVSVRV
jgi:hypothetical protein